MEKFNSLDKNFREAFIRARKRGIVRFSVEKIKENPDSIYPIFTVSHKHVSYYDVEQQTDIVITDMNLTAIIY